MNLEQKNILYKLFSEENINVVRKKVDTASFNIKTRTITMPEFDDMTPAMEDTLGGHESSHAKYTPTTWSFDPSHIDNNKYTYIDSKIKSFVNVVEDARIERLIKQDYPGLAKVMIKGYQDFMDRDFFKLNGKNPNDFLLIDRINLRFKLGINFNVNFTDEEQVFVDRVSVCNEDEVISLSQEIYDYCKKEQEQKEEELAQQMADDDLDFEDEDEDEDEDGDDNQLEGKGSDESTESFDDSEESDENSDESDESSDEQTEDTSSSSISNSNDDTEEDVEQTQETSYSKGYDHSEVVSHTDTSFSQSLVDATSDKEITNAVFPEYDISSMIIPWKKVKLLRDEYYDIKKRYSNENTLLRFEKENKSAINYLVKEFEMRKKAAEYKRTQVANTGSINPNKLHSYKFNDDIFRKIGITPEGKNHGVTLFLDLSGSMHDLIKPTIEQLVTVTHFLRKVSIPFEVHTFTTGNGKLDAEFNIDRNEMANKSGLKYKDNDLTLRDNLSDIFMMNILSSKMTNTQYRKMADDLLDVAHLSVNYNKLINRNSVSVHSVFDKHRYYSNWYWNFHLGGTPLNTLMGGAVKMINKFKTDNRIEKHTILLVSDGHDYDYGFIYDAEADYERSQENISPSIGKNVSYIKDSKSGKIYKTHEKSITPTIVDRLRDRTNSTIINFFIIPNKSYEIENCFRRHGIKVYTYGSDVDPIKEFRAKKQTSVYDFGYDEVIIIPSTALNLENDSLDELVSSEDSIRKITSAFKKMNKGRLTNRVFLSKIIENVA